MDYEGLASDFMRELRGQRSQVAWSRRMGYRSNVAYPWETGRRFPSASEGLRAIERSGRSLTDGLTRFYGRPPAWLDEIDPCSPEAVVRLLDDLRGTRTVTAIAKSAGLNRHAVSRWTTGRTQPRLPDLFRVIEATSVRLADFVAAFVDPERLPGLVEVWRRLEARRAGAARHPWTQALLRVIELDEYGALDTHDHQWVADRLGIDVSLVTEGFGFLEVSGQVEEVNGLLIGRALAVDTRRSPEVGRHLKAHWTDVAGNRIRAGAPGQFSYNVFSVSDEDFERIRALHLKYFHALRSIVADSERGDKVVVANVQLFALAGDEKL